MAKLDVVEESVLRWPDGCERTRIKERKPQAAWFPAGIFVTSIVPPAQGWPIAMYCPLCKETTFILSPYAIKPEKGDYWLMKDTCGSDVLGDMHGIQIALDRMQMELLKYPISPKSIYGYDPLEEK